MKDNKQTKDAFQVTLGDVLTMLPVVLLFDVPIAFAIAFVLRLAVDRNIVSEPVGILIGMCCCTFVYGLIASFDASHPPEE